MEVSYINPFLEALQKVLEQFGIADIKVGNLKKKENMCVESDITSVIGLVGDIRGNIAFALSDETAKHITSIMMGGAPVLEMDAIARSAIGELANMITGTAATLLSQAAAVTEITPPSIIFGKNILLILSSIQTIEINVMTQLGDIAVNIGLEM